MREIKFRAWDKIEKTMLSFSNIAPMRWVYDGSLEDMFDNSSDDIKWMQYTGLKDKNGVEIYEGDILDKKWKLEVYFKNGAFYVSVPHGENNKKTMLVYDWLKHREKAGIPQEVIGNIYENPELLES